MIVTKVLAIKELISSEKKREKKFLEPIYGLFNKS